MEEEDKTIYLPRVRGGKKKTFKESTSEERNAPTTADRRRLLVHMYPQPHTHKHTHTH